MNNEKPPETNIRPEEVLEFLTEVGAISSGVVLSNADIEAIGARSNILLSERPNMTVELAAVIAYLDRRAALNPNAGAILNQTDPSLLQKILETTTGNTVTDEEAAIFLQYLSHQTYGANMPLTEIIENWSSERSAATKGVLPQVAIGGKGDEILHVGPPERATAQKAQDQRAEG